MKVNFYIEFLSLISFLLFIITSFINFDKNSILNKSIYLSNLLFLSIFNLFYYLIIYKTSSTLTNITSLLIVILFFTFFFLSIFSFKFIKLRLLFIPFFLILIIFRSLVSKSSNEISSTVEIFSNKLLLLHILSSLFAYSMLTVSAITSICVFIKASALKRLNYSITLINLLPSLFESEILSIRFLKLTVFFLLVSLTSGFFYHLFEYEDLLYFFNSKVILSIITLILIISFIWIRHVKGLSNILTFKVILLSYLFINLSYFGIKLVN